MDRKARLSVLLSALMLGSLAVGLVQVPRPTGSNFDSSTSTHQTNAADHTMLAGFPAVYEQSLPGFSPELPYNATSSVSGVSFDPHGTDVSQLIVSGNTHFCTLNAGQVFCWGTSGGYLGSGSNSYGYSPQPVRFPTNSPAQKIAAGGYTTCAIMADGTVYCWGINWNNGIDRLPTQLQLPGDEDAKAIDVVSQGHGCVVLESGTLHCWGYNSKGQLGRGTTGGNWPLSTDPGNTSSRVNLGQNVQISKVSVGAESTCALLDSGTLKCWGNNEHGELGIGSTISTSFPTPVPVPAGRTVIDVEVGEEHICHVLDNGSARCAGNNFDGHFGNAVSGSNAAVSSPVYVEFPVGVNATSVHNVGKDARVSCFSTTDGVYCAGNNQYGLLGTGSAGGVESTPLRLEEPQNRSIITAVSTRLNLCVVVSTGEVLCAGSTQGLGFQTTVSSYEFGSIPFVRETVERIYGFGANYCAESTDGLLYCWGLNNEGQLGNGLRLQPHDSNDASLPSLTMLPTGSNITSLSGSSKTACATFENGSLYCWGKNRIYSSGDIWYAIDPDINESSDWNFEIPVQVDTTSNLDVLKVSVGSSICAIFSDSKIRCWGVNNQGQLGINKTLFPTRSVNEASEIIFDSNQSAPVDIATSTDHSCALFENGSVACWGSAASGRTGIGPTNSTIIYSPQFLDVAGMENVTDLFVRYSETCVLTNTSELYCWGYNLNGQLGVGDNSKRWSPTLVNFSKNGYPTSIGMGNHHTCSLFNDSSILCTGKKDDNRLGKYYSTDQHSYVSTGPVLSKNFTEIATAGESNCGLLNSGQVECWGRGIWGQLGTGTTGSKTFDQSSRVLFPAKSNLTVSVSNQPAWSGIPTDLGPGWLNVTQTTGSNILHWNTSVLIESPLVYPSSSMVAGAQSSLFPTMNGGPYQIDAVDDLPDGLLLDPLTGELTGFFASPRGNVDVRIQLIGSAGIGFFDMILAIVDNEPSLVETEFNHANYRGFRMNALQTNNSGGLVTSTTSDVPETGIRLTDQKHSTSLFLSDESFCGKSTNGLECFYPRSTGVQTITEGPVHSVFLGNLNRTCYIDSDGLSCINEDPSSLANLASVTDSSHISGWDDHLCIAEQYETVRCQGPDVTNQGQTTVELTYEGEEIKALHPSTGFVCIETTSGMVSCYGSDEYTFSKVAGNASQQNQSNYGIVGGDLEFGSPVHDLAVGSSHGCAVLSTSNTVCWGAGASGQLGNGYAVGLSGFTPVAAPQWVQFTSVSTGNSHSCGMTTIGQPMCWGSNSVGQLGNGGTVNSFVPTNVTNIPSWLVVRNVVAIGDGTCVIAEDGGGWCWGDNTGQRLGLNQSLASTSTPQPIRFHGGAPLMDSSLGLALIGVPSLEPGVHSINFTAANSGGGSDLSLNLTVSAAVEYSSYDLVAALNSTFVHTPDRIQGGPYLFTMHPNLPQGMHLGSHNGTIWGQPTEWSPKQDYALHVENNHGWDVIPFTIDVQDIPPKIRYPITTHVLIEGVSDVEIKPELLGGHVAEWSIWPMLPDGLLFEEGEISGVPLDTSDTTVYFVYANSSSGSSVFAISLGVFEETFTINLLETSVSVTIGESLNVELCRVSAGSVSEVRVVPELPAGLSLVDCVLQGVALQNHSASNYLLKGPGGESSVVFELVVEDPIVSIQLIGGELSVTRSEPMSSRIVSSTGGPVAAWQTFPPLPDGLSIEGGQLVGSPEQNLTRTLFTLQASNSGGEDSVTFWLTVNEPKPAFTYDPSSVRLFRNTAFDRVTPVSTGGHVESWTITPTLPSGLFFDESRGTIQGAPLALSPVVEYTIRAQNSGGTSEASLSLEVLNRAPQFSLPSENLRVAAGSQIPQFRPQSSAQDVVSSWSYALVGGGALPSTVVFDATTGVFSGTAPDAASVWEIQLIASNDGGSTSMNFSITVLADFDRDGIPDVDDQDDDNDGYSDVDEEKRGSNPYDATSSPVEGFEFIVPGTQISLGAWDILGMLGGVPLTGWILFGVLTRNSRSARYEEQVNAASTRDELELVAQQYERALKFRLIGSHQSLRLERMRAERDDQLEHVSREFASDDPQRHDGLNEESKFYPDVEQAPLLSEDLSDDRGTASMIEHPSDGIDDHAHTDEGGVDGMVDVELPHVSEAPDASVEADVTDDEGYEWYTTEDGTNYYRVAESGDEWQLFDS